MSLEPPAGRSQGGPESEEAESSALDYWHSLINEGIAADFADLSKRTMQGFRQNGGGPKYIRISARCIRYTRAWLKDWADARSANSTAEYGDAE